MTYEFTNSAERTDRRTRRKSIGLVAGGLIVAGIAGGIGADPHVRHAVGEALHPAQTTSMQFTRRQARHAQQIGKSRAKDILGGLNIAKSYQKYPMPGNEATVIAVPRDTEAIVINKLSDGGELDTNTKLIARGNDLTMSENFVGQATKKDLLGGTVTHITFTNAHRFPPANLSVRSATTYLNDPGTHMSAFESGNAMPTYRVSLGEDGLTTLHHLNNEDTGFDKPLDGYNFDDVKKRPDRLPEFIDQQLASS